MGIWAVEQIRTVDEIRRFHEDLKRRMPAVSGFAQLQGLKNQSDELCRWLYTPEHARLFGNQIDEARRVALAENAELAALATSIAKKHDWNREFRSWAD